MADQLVVIDPLEITITPIFKIVQVENVPKSETAGYAVMETKEMVEVRFAGQRNYSPMFPADAFSRREGNRVITYAERWPEQYRQFKEGVPQEALGTPLEMLRSHGVSPEQLSLCRALKIYSIESLHHLPSPQAKSLGMHVNLLKKAAADFLADRSKGGDAMAEIEALKAQIAELQGRSTLTPAADPTTADMDQALAAADAAIEAMTDEQIKVEIKRITGSRPNGNPSRATLISALKELKEAA